MISSQRPALPLAAFASLALLALFACSSKSEPQPAPAAPPLTVQPFVESSPASRVAKEAELDTYVYSPIGKRDPFRSMFETDTPKPQITSELQRWNIDELKLIAVVTGTPAPYAMIEDPKGKGHVVRRGSYVGRNFGRVVSIKTSDVTIREEYRSYTGAKVMNDVTMVIPQPKLQLEDDS